MPITIHSFAPYPAPGLSFTLTRTAGWDAASAIQLPTSKQGRNSLLCVNDVVSSSSWIMLEFCSQFHCCSSCSSSSPNLYSCTISSVLSGGMGNGIIASYSLRDSLNTLHL
ncbi:hypothetical protein D5086_022312 [Populus alba]|uniref:Uncharacterized protein n=1 Tax=Populus alba TaxID=43335 RepID=A0ACC4BG57_POPAL